VNRFRDLGRKTTVFFPWENGKTIGKPIWRETPSDRTITRPGKPTVCDIENGPVEIVDLPISEPLDLNSG
jgi:hypothetical protein